MPYKNIEDRRTNVKEWKKKNPEYMKEYRKNNPEFYSEYGKKWRNKNKEYLTEFKRKYIRQLRIDVLNILSDNNPHCIKCGCDDIRLLIINHKKGDGSKEYRGIGKHTNFLQSIRQGKRTINDLELLCGICHSLYHFELKYGELPYEILYNIKNK